MTFKEFDVLFDRFTVSTFRLETLQQYAVSEEDENYLAAASYMRHLTGD